MFKDLYADDGGNVHIKSEEFNEYQNLLKGENTIKQLLSFAEHNLTPYVLYLDDVKRDIFEESIHS